jgi:hypothetical protein
MQKKFGQRIPKSNLTSKKHHPKTSLSVGNVLISMALILAIGFVVYQVFGIWGKKHRVALERQEFLSQISKLEFENKELEKIKQYLSSPNYQEKEIKNKLDLKKPGETAVIVPEVVLPENLSNEDLVRILKEDAKNYLPKAQTNREKWWAFFFDKNKL